MEIDEVPQERKKKRDRKKLKFGDKNTNVGGNPQEKDQDALPLHEDDFMLVQLKSAETKKNSKINNKFIGRIKEIVQEEDDEELLVSFLKSSNKVPKKKLFHSLFLFKIE